MTNELIKVTAYDEFRAKVGEVKEVCNFLPDVTTTEGYEKSKRIALDVGKILTAIEKKRTELKAESLAYGRMIDSEAKSIVEELQAFQLPHKNAYKELDDLRKEREATRKATIEARLNAIKVIPELMAGEDSAKIKSVLDDLIKEECLDFEEYTELSVRAKTASKEALTALLDAKLKQEKEAAELVELRAKQAAQEQKERDERIAKDAAEKANREAEEALAREAKAIELAAEAVRQREAAEKQAEINAKLAEDRRIEAEKQAEIRAKEAAEAAKNQAIKEQEEKENAELAEKERREANTRHVSKIRGEAKQSLMALGLTEEQSKNVVLAIHNGLIANVTIAY